MSPAEYYVECIAEAFCGIDKWEIWRSLSEQDRREVGEAVAGSAENFSTAFGYDCIPDPRNTEIDRLKAQHKKELADLQAECDAWRTGIARHVRIEPRRLSVNNGEIEVSRN